jgi:hypothetical protein
MSFEPRSNGVRRLHWGCGDWVEPGWINADVKDLPEVDLCCVGQAFPEVPDADRAGFRARVEAEAAPIGGELTVDAVLDNRSPRENRCGQDASGRSSGGLDRRPTTAERLPARRGPPPTMVAAETLSAGGAWREGDLFLLK